MTLSRVYFFGGLSEGALIRQMAKHPEGWIKQAGSKEVAGAELFTKTAGPTCRLMGFLKACSFGLSWMNRCFSLKAETKQNIKRVGRCSMMYWYSLVFYTLTSLLEIAQGWFFFWKAGGCGSGTRLWQISLDPRDLHVFDFTNSKVDN